MDLVTIYLRNRFSFYRELLPRIPHARLRQELQTAVDFNPAAEADLPAEALPAEISDPFLSALALRDALKKPAYGVALGRTTISFAEALTRAQGLEETGFLLFDRLAVLVPAASGEFRRYADQHQNHLRSLLTLEDSLRYHRLRLKD